MVEMQIDSNTKLQIYAVGGILTAVVVDTGGNVKANKEIHPVEIANMLQLS